MAAHRYWRLLVTAVTSGAQVAIGEVVLATTPGGGQAATGGAASASSVSTTNTANKAFNGTLSASDYWLSASGGYSSGGADGYRQGVEWVQYDFGAGNEKDIVELRLYYPAAGSVSLTLSPVQFSLYYSDDGKAWKVQRAWSGQVFAAGETKTFDATPLPGASISNLMLLDKRYRNNEHAQPQSAINANARRFSKLFAGDNYLTPCRITPYSGTKRISGSTTVLGLPAARMVHLFDQKRGQLIATTLTRADGQFRFSELAPGVYTVMGVDTTGAQNSVVYAHVEAVD